MDIPDIPDNSQTGTTLIELIIALLIISIALTGMLSVINLTTAHSADPLIQHQAVAIAEAYLEEILLQDYADPNGVELGESRASFDDVDDYHGLNDTGVHDQQGNAVATLSDYDVTVQVTGATLPAGIAAKKVQVSATGPGAVNIVLTGYRTLQ